MRRPLRMALVGGGPGAFIGPVHRMAAELDGHFKLVAGAFSHDPNKSRAAGEAYGVEIERSYPDYRMMLAAERERVDGIEVVVIATPNHLHLPIALASLQAGMHVISDKPATATLAQALELREAVRSSKAIYALTYTYTGYPMIRETRERIARGNLGALRKIVVEYPQSWLSEPIERRGNPQAAWRTDPTRAGIGGCIADIGIHAFQLAEHVSGLKVVELCADLASIVPGRALDDDCNVLLRFEGGPRGVLIASQISTGERNGLTLRLYGEKGGLTWSHETPNILTFNPDDGCSHVLHAGTAGLAGPARLPTGHPEGFIEALANLYRDIARAISGERDLIDTLVPGIEAGVRSLRFVECAVENSRQHCGWSALSEEKEQ